MKRVVVLTAFVLVSMVAALAPPGTPTEAQGDCFGNGFCITNAAFSKYFRERGGRNIFGDAISRSFTLDGFEVQFFQRLVLQAQAGGVSRLNILDDAIMPMTRVNQSQFPKSDPQILAQAPQNPASPTYADDAINFIKKVSPNDFNGVHVGFFDLFNTTVPVDIAFPGQTPNPGLITLANLEIWGLPTSNPAPDPGNGGFIYQRYQRGIMHYEDTCKCSHGILVGQYFKAVMTGQDLPADLAQDMAGSRFFKQYSPSSPNWIARPGELPSSDLTAAFEPGTGAVAQPTAGPATQVPIGVATATFTPTPGAIGPTVTLQVDDERIDPGQTIAVTVIARYPTAIDWIEFEGVPGDNNNDNDVATDPALTRQRFDCDGRTECANVWTITPSISGNVTLRARSRGKDGVRSDWSTLTLRVRQGTATTTPTAVVVTATTAPPTAAPAVATATATIVLPTIPPTQPIPGGGSPTP